MNPILFRQHRGSLEDSIKTTVPIESLDNIRYIIRSSWGCELYNIIVEYYCYDDRINWDTYIVTARPDFSKDRVVLGFTNASLKE